MACTFGISMYWNKIGFDIILICQLNKNNVEQTRANYLKLSNPNSPRAKGSYEYKVIKLIN